MIPFSAVFDNPTSDVQVLSPPGLDVWSDVSAIEAIRVSNARLAPFNVSGVYFLCTTAQLVYVGKSCDIAKRLGNHMFGRNGVRFEYAFYLPIRSCKSGDVEKLFITAYRPPHNKVGVIGQISKRRRLFDACESELCALGVDTEALHDLLEI